jgi:hypothetical protein
MADAGTVNKAVVATIKAQVDNSVKEGFARLSGQAKAAAKDVESVGPAAEKATAVAGRGLSGFAGDLRKTDRGVKFLEQGLLGLAATGGAVDERFAKMTFGLYAMHSAAQTMRGLSMATTGLHVGAVGLLPVLGGIAAGIAAVGAVAVSASPKLQNSLGSALFEMTEHGKAQIAMLNRMKATLMETAAARGLGIGTAKEEAAFATRAPFMATARGGYDRLADIQTRLQAARLFPDRAFDPQREALQAAGIDVSRLMSGGQLGIGRGELGTAQAGLAGLIHGRIGGFRPDAGLLREQYEAGGALQQAGGRVAALQRERADFQRRERLTKDISEHELINLRENLIPAARADAGKFSMWKLLNWDLYGEGDLFTKGGTPEQFRLKGLQDRQKALEGGGSGRARIAAAAGGFRPTLAGEGEDIDKRMADALKEQEQAYNRVLDIQKRISQAKVDDLKTLREESRERSKSYEAAIHSEQQRLRGLTGSLANATPGELAGLMSAGQQLRAGGQISGDTRDLLNRFGGVTGEALGAYDYKRGAANPDVARVMDIFGTGDQLTRLQQATKFEANIQNKLEVSLKDLQVTAGNELGKQLADGLKPIIEKVVKEALESSQRAVERAAKQEVLKNAMQIATGIAGAS